MSEPTTSHATTNRTPQVQGIKPPEKLILTGNAAENWKTYKQIWSNYSIIANLEAREESYRVALFLHCIGPEALKIYNGFSFEEEGDRQKLEKIMEKFEKYSVGEINETYERYVFNSRNQGPNESFDAYLTELKSLARSCNFAALNESLIRDRIVVGIQSQQTKKKLLQQRDLSLKSCIDICRSAEATATQMKNLTAQQSVDVHAVKTKFKVKKPKGRKNDRYAQGDRKNVCKFCGGNHAKGRLNCPAWEKNLP